MESPVVQLRFVAVASGTLALPFVLLLLPAPGSLGTSDFQNRIAVIETRTSSRIGVAALDTASGKRLGYRSENVSRCAARLSFWLQRRC